MKLCIKLNLFILNLIAFICSKNGHIHLFSENKNYSSVKCDGTFLLGKCLSNSKKQNRFYSCSECEFDYHLCEYCLDEF